MKKLAETCEPRVPEKNECCEIEGKNCELRNNVVSWDWEEHEQESGEWRNLVEETMSCRQLRLLLFQVKEEDDELGLVMKLGFSRADPFIEFCSLPN